MSAEEELEESIFVERWAKILYHICIFVIGFMFAVGVNYCCMTWSSLLISHRMPDPFTLNTWLIISGIIAGLVYSFEKKR